MAATPTTTLHRRLERFQSALHRQLPVSLRQTSATMGPQIHQVPGDETLRSYLKRFQTMRNRIPEVAEAAVIEDFYRGSNDSAFVRAILQKVPTTSEQLFWEADLYITADERALDLIGGAKPAPTAPRRDTNQQPDKRWEKRPREEVHAAGPPASHTRGGPRGGERTLDDILDAQCPYHKDMRHTLWNCRDFKHSVGNGRPFQPLPPPPLRGGPGEPRQPQQQEEGGGGAFPRVDREVNVIFGGHGSQESKRQQKLNDRQILVAAIGPPALYRWSEHPITFTRADQWLNFDHPGKYPLLVDPVIRESRVKKVLVDGGAASTSPSPAQSKAWEFTSKSSTSRTLLSSASCRLKENIRWATSTCRSPSELRRTTEPSS
jgi:hypothetical protein